MATISNVNGKKITKIKYKGEIYDTGGGGSGATSTLKTLLDATQSTYHLFYNYKGTSIDGLISYDDTENVKKMNEMFYNCSNLTTMPLFNTTNVVDMEYMFYKCSNLTTMPLFNTTKVTSMNQMFYQCSSLINVKINMGLVNNTYSMFYQCSNLKTIDITQSCSRFDNWFATDCYSLTKFIIRNMPTIPALSSNAFNNCYHFTGTTNETYNPQGLKDGRIYVPDDKVEELKAATNWSVYADIIVPLSTLVE